MRFTHGLAPLATHAPTHCSAGVRAVLQALADRQQVLFISLEMNPKRVEQTVERVLKIQPSQRGFLIGSTRL